MRMCLDPVDKPLGKRLFDIIGGFAVIAGNEHAVAVAEDLPPSVVVTALPTIQSHPFRASFAMAFSRGFGLGDEADDQTWAGSWFDEWRMSGFSVSSRCGVCFAA